MSQLCNTQQRLFNESIWWFQAVAKSKLAKATNRDCLKINYQTALPQFGADSNLKMFVCWTSSVDSDFTNAVILAHLVINYTPFDSSRKALASCSFKDLGDEHTLFSSLHFSVLCLHLNPRDPVRSSIYRSDQHFLLSNQFLLKLCID